MAFAVGLCEFSGKFRNYTNADSERERKVPEPCMCAMAKSKQMGEGRGEDSKKRGKGEDKVKMMKKRRKATKTKAALTDASQKKSLSFCFSTAVVSEQCVTVVSLHFRCRAWQTRILDANHHDLLPEDSIDVYEVIRHENANLWTCSVLLL